MSNTDLEKLVKKIVESEIFIDAPDELLSFLKDDEFFISMHFNQESEENEEIEICEYYLVSKWLGEKLLNKKESVFALSNCYLWGRKDTTSIYFDEIIADICNDL